MATCCEWWRTTVFTIVAAALTIYTILVFPYKSTASVAGKGVVFTVGGLWYAFTSLVYYYAWSFRYAIIALSAAGYDWSAGYCDPTGGVWFFWMVD